MSNQNYSSIPSPGSPSHTEAWALTEAARRIAMGLEKMVTVEALKLPAAKRELRDAIRLNWRLWTIFQAELTLDTNPVPFDMRQNMLTLCQFVDNHTIQCMSDLDPEKIKTLIDINRNIAQGLLEGISNAQQDGSSNQPQAPAAPAGGTINTDA